MKQKIKISFNAPAVLTFTFIAFGALILDRITGGWANKALFSVYRSPFRDPLTYVRFVGHVFGHAGMDHFMGNIMYMLILGPLLEEKYGTSNITLVILVTAVVTGILNFIFFPRVMLLGASGVVFAFILLSSITSMKSGHIPLTFIIVAAVYLGQQVYQGIFIRDNTAHFMHIIGGITGSVLGFLLNRK